MIRTLWVMLALGASTAFYGGAAILGSLLRVGTPRFYWWATRGWARAVLAASGTPVVIHGAENLHADRAQVIVSNHLSWFDIFAIAGILPMPYHFVAKSELERIPLFGSAWKAAGHISIDRANRQKAFESLRQAGEKVRTQRSAVVIYPEGTRSRTGRLMPFKKGAFMLAAEAGVPVVPCVVVGSFDIMRPDDWRIHPRPIHLHFREPILCDGVGSAGLDALMDRVRRSMVEVLGEEEEMPPLEGPAVVDDVPGVARG